MKTEEESFLERLVIRADASPEIGTGHVMRCLALAQQWRDRGGQVVFAMAESTQAIRARVAAEGCEFVDVPAPVGSMEDCQWLVEYARSRHAAWVVLDGYRFGAEFHRIVRDAGCRLMCIDDEGRCSEHGAEVILNQNVSATPEMYARSTRSRCLLGPRYALLRREFFPWRDGKRTIAATARSVLVTLGGSTPREAAKTVLAALARIQTREVVVNFVIGGSTASPETIEQTAGSPAVSFLRNPPNMPELMATADVAISASGATCWELCFLGVPSLLIDIAPNQTPIAECLHRGGYAIHAGAADSLSVNGLATGLQDLMGSQPRRQGLSDRCMSLVDGGGAARVVAATRPTLTEWAEDTDVAVRA